MTVKILVVEDDPAQQEVMSLLLQRKLGYTGVSATDGRTALSTLQKDPDIKLVILDLGLPDMSGIEVLEIVMQRHPGLPVIMLTANSDLDHAVEAMKAGAYDFLAKPPEKERLRTVIQNALKTSLLEKEILRLKRQEVGAFTFNQLIGHDNGLAEIIKTGRKAASSDIPVLLTGETGTGKEVFARAIHGESHRVGKPFVAVNCGAIPAQLVESILFGHEKGAFTGAISKTIGKFRESEGGTIFLDEVGELTLEAQVKLLRVLQQKEIGPVGASRNVPVNVRVISATNRNLETSVAEGKFREDLYFRLNVLPIHLPALRDRARDVPELAHHFIERFAALESRPLKNISTESLKMLSARLWPGNVRELENVVHRAMVLCETSTLEVKDFSALPLPSSDAENKYPGFRGIALTRPDGNVRKLADIERDALEFGLEHCGGNITQAAMALGIAKSTFYRRIKELRESG